MEGRSEMVQVTPAATQWTLIGGCTATEVIDIETVQWDIGATLFCHWPLV